MCSKLKERIQYTNYGRCPPQRRAPGVRIEFNLENELEPDLSLTAIQRGYPVRQSQEVYGRDRTGRISLRISSNRQRIQLIYAIYVENVEEFSERLKT